jgi:hypothetical protein
VPHHLSELSYLATEVIDCLEGVPGEVIWDPLHSVVLLSGQDPSTFDIRKATSRDDNEIIGVPDPESPKP